MIKIFVVGDSISMHYNDDLKRFLSGYAMLKRKGEGEKPGDLDYESKVNGGDSACVLGYLQATPDIDADIFIVNCGLHDIKFYHEVGHLQVEPEDYRENLKQIVAHIQKLGKQMVWVMSTTVDDEIHKKNCSVFFRKNEDIKQYNHIAKEVMEQMGVPIIDLYDFTEKLGDGVFCDHVHFKPHVRTLHAAFIAGQVIGLFGLKKTNELS